ncbi:MAG: RNA polymerase sigma factor [Saprospiraceae bacterium]|nr:RNA polymerase sigma factor [Saprospiraceae bacterium]
MVNQQKESGVIEAVRNYGKRLSRFIRSRVSSVEDAEDILQDVWFQLSNMVDIEQIEQVNAWLFRVARNKITDKYRKQTPQSLDDLVYEDEDGEILFKDILLSDFNTPETEHLKEVFWQELFVALDELPANQREVFILNEMEDMTLQEIANQTGENLKTIISRKGYAVKYLRKRLQTLYDEFWTY